MQSANVISTVETAASSYNLITRAAFKAELGITTSANDAYIDGLVAQASAMASTYCNNPFVVETIQDEFWPQRDPYPFQTPGGAAPLQLSRYPVIAVTSVVENSATLSDGTDFRVVYQRGQLIRLDSVLYPTVWQPVPSVVVYSAGYPTVPADLAEAVMRLARGRWFARQRDPQLRSENVAGVYEASYWFGSGPGASAGMPPDITAVLDSYRVPVTA